MDQQEDYSKYQPVDIKFFQKLETSPCALYIKLTDEKFVKVLKPSDPITTDFLLKYIKRNITHIYVASLDYEKHSDIIFSFTPAMSQMLQKGRELRLPPSESLHAIVEEIGVDDKTTKLVGKLSDQIVDQLNTQDNLVNILNPSFYGEKRFIYDHSYLTSLVSCFLADLPQNEWGNTSAKEKLCISAIFHDLALDKEEAIDVESEGIHEGIANDLIDERNLHPKLMADKLRNQDLIPIDVVSIIENHHNTSKSNLSPLICAFIVAHQFVLEMYKVKFEKSELPSALNNILEKFPSGNLNKQAKILTEALGGK